MTRSKGTGSAGGAASAPAVEIRPVAARGEYESCVELQREVWGVGYSEIVPVTLMEVAARVGGVCVGAFRGGELLGFVFGMTGPLNGELAHWSHMLAVRRGSRGRGLGARLKFAQRKSAAALGARFVHWTFDPLVSRNAHFALNRLGASVAEYVPEMYGPSGSALHRLGTDRLVARWGVSDDVDATLAERRRAAPGATRADASHEESLGLPGTSFAMPGGSTKVVEVAIPNDIRAVQTRDFGEALAWRAANRGAFAGLLGAGYRVVGFARGGEMGRYLLAKGTAKGAAGTGGD